MGSREAESASKNEIQSRVDFTRRITGPSPSKNGIESRWLDACVRVQVSGLGA